MSRPPQLQTLVDALESAIDATCPPGDARACAHSIFSALRESTGEQRPTEQKEPLDCLTNLPGAISNTRAGPSHCADLATAFDALYPDLAWQRRPGSETDPAFHSGHATTPIIGPLGIEVRSDVIIGAGLVAPGVAYPYHSHPPEELYAVLSDSEWYNESQGWYRPGLGNVVFHTPNVQHAMRATNAPLLAVWALYTGASPP